MTQANNIININKTVLKVLNGFLEGRTLSFNLFGILF